MRMQMTTKMKTYRLPVDIIRRLKELADRERRPVSQQLILIIEKALEAEEKKEEGL